MLPRHLLGLGFLLGVIVADSRAAEAPATTASGSVSALAPPRSPLLRESLRTFLYHAPGTEPPAAPAPPPKPLEAPVLLPRFEVQERPDRTFAELNDMLAQRERLRTPAVKSGTFGGLHYDFLVRPHLDTDGAGGPRLVLPILQIKW